MNQHTDKGLFVISALKQVIDYREGKGRFDLSRLNEYDRANESHDLWQEVECDIRQAIEFLENKNTVE
jgi:hypothetical protein